MKLRNPRSRNNLQINRRERVLEVGGGHNPHPRANVVVDKFVDSNYHRHSNLKVLKHQEFIAADGADMPFEDKSFDYLICNQVLEHVEDPASFVNELSRVATRGYIETPSVIGEYLFPKKSHKWLVLELNNKLILVEKENVWFDTKLDFGFLFLTWLQKTSLSYKMLMRTRPNFMTVRYEWKDDIEIVVNPEDTEVLEYFSNVWNEEMVSGFFPQKGKLKELVESFIAMISISLQALFLRRR